MEVLFEAFDRSLAANLSDSDPTGPPVDRVLHHEERYWRGTAPAEIDLHLMRRCVAAATMAGAADNQQSDAVVMAATYDRNFSADVRRRVVNWLAECYPGPARLNPLRPDRLGEALVGQSLRGGDGEAFLGTLLRLSTDDQLANCLDVLARVAAKDEAVAHLVVGILSMRLKELVDRANSQTASLPSIPRPSSIVQGLLRLLTQHVAQGLAAAEPGHTTFWRDLASSYQQLADLAANAGQGEEARRLHAECLTLRDVVVASQPNDRTCQRELSMSYRRLAELAWETGRDEEARRLHDEGINIAEVLATWEPNNTTYLRDLSLLYETLAYQEWEAGHDEEAWRLYSECLHLQVALAAWEPDNRAYQRDLSNSYQRLAASARDAGRNEEARRLYREGLRIAEGLIAADPITTTSREQLWSSYEKLAAMAWDVGDVQEARRLYGECARIAEALVTTEPDNASYLEKLLRSYDMQVYLARDAGRVADAQRLYGERLRVAEALVRSREIDPT